jgi:Ni/Co efflux regulator RcnB
MTVHSSHSTHSWEVIMFTKAILATALMAAVVAPLAASAGEVQNRINDQQARIAHGVRDGALTRGEFNHLERSENRIERERDRDLRMNGGRLTPGERASLNRQENRQSNRIFFDTHNAARQH